MLEGNEGVNLVLVEIGGADGDIEGLPFLRRSASSATTFAMWSTSI